jgi:hypothetical protein
MNVVELLKSRAEEKRFGVIELAVITDGTEASRQAEREIMESLPI